MSLSDELLRHRHSCAILVSHQFVGAWANARLAFDEADAGQALIYVPAIVIAVEREEGKTTRLRDKVRAAGSK